MDTARVLYVMVDCFLDGKILASYEFGIPGSVAAAPILNHQELITAAKENLSNEHKAFPPYAGITFKIREVGIS